MSSSYLLWLTSIPRPLFTFHSYPSVNIFDLFSPFSLVCVYQSCLCVVFNLFVFPLSNENTCIYLPFIWFIWNNVFLIFFFLYPLCMGVKSTFFFSSQVFYLKCWCTKTMAEQCTVGEFTLLSAGSLCMGDSIFHFTKLQVYSLNEATDILEWLLRLSGNILLNPILEGSMAVTRRMYRFFIACNT